MLGRICWAEGRRIHLRQEQILGVTCLTLALPTREGGFERRLEKGCRLLRKRRVTRVLTPPGFPGWNILLQHGLRPVDTVALRCALAPAWVRATLQSIGIRPEQATVALSGERESPDMVCVAKHLCPTVRRLVVSVPEDRGLAVLLRREFGLPVVPVHSTRADVILRFDSGPVLNGARLTLRGETMPSNCEVLPLLSVLWECGKVKTEEITLTV